MHLDAGLLLHDLRQQFLCPCRTWITKVGGLLVHDFIKSGQVLFVELGLTIVLASIVKPGDAMIAKPPDHPAHPRNRASDCLGDR